MKTRSRFLLVVGLFITLSAVLLYSNQIYHRKNLIKSPTSGQTENRSSTAIAKDGKAVSGETADLRESTSPSSEVAANSAAKDSRETTAVATPNATTPEQVLHATEADGIRSRLSMGGNGSPNGQSISPFRSLGAGQTGQGLQDFERAHSRPVEDHLRRGRSFDGDVRNLPRTRPVKQDRPEHEEPHITPRMLGGTPAVTSGQNAQTPETAVTPSAAAPPPILNFDGLDFATWGAGHPPDTNGDVGPTYYIQNINTSIGIYRKSDQVRVAAFTFNTLMSQGAFGNLCDTNNFGDPVVLYDTFEDRWIITDFAFQLVSGNAVSPEDQCFAVSKTGDPVNGGWNFYSRTITDNFGDYPKFGIWIDGLYMSSNLFTFGASSTYVSPRATAFNKAQMYAGAPTVQVVTFDAPSNDFTILPSNARIQVGTPPPGTPNYYVSTEVFLNAETVYKFHVDWNKISLSTFTGPDTPLAPTSWPNANVANAPSLGGNALDVLQIRAMMQNQYTNIGGAESLWTAHTVRRQNTTGFAAPRFYQVNVTGGAVNGTMVQGATFDPDGANVINRFLPSVAVDRAGDMMMGYSTSDATTKPAIKYAGRLSTDPVNTLPQSEQLLIQGTGTQTGSCSGTCTRWGDYSAMTLDMDGCTFWYTNMYYAVDGLAFLTRIGTTAFPSCTPATSTSTIQGTVTATVGGAPISGATVALGSRSTTTDGSGNYSFTGLPSGTYPTISASKPGFNQSSATNIAVSDGGTTTQNFSLGTAATSSCLVDTTQSDFQSGVATGCDLTTNPGDITLPQVNVDQQNLNLGTSGVGITTTIWKGETFTAGVTGQLTRVDVNLFCNACTGTTPNLTLSIRSTNSNTPSTAIPTGADIASATIPGFSSNSGIYYTANFATPPTLVAGTMYAIVIRPTANPSAGTYALTKSGTNTTGSVVYANGRHISGATSGTVWSVPTFGGTAANAGFKTFMSAFPPSGNFVSSVKDANPAGGSLAEWGTISWTADTPAGTNIQFQVAGSNSPTGPFNFVGPDGTSGTFFTNGGSLSQFGGKRYLQYKAIFTTSSSAVTPTLHDVTICFTDVITAYSDPGGTCAGNTPCFTTIQNAINAVPDGGQVFVLPGVYSEGINLIRNVTLNISGNVTVNSVSFTNGIINGGSSNITNKGDWTNGGGTFNPGSSTITMFGSAGPPPPPPVAPGGGATNKVVPSTGPQVINGTNTFTNLTINDPNGVTFNGGDQTVTGTLTLSQGILTTNTNTLIMSSTGGIVRTADFILGTVTKQAISGSYSFPMGDNNGFTPLNVANASGGGDFTVLTTSATAGSLNPATTLGEFWTLTANGSVTLDLTFNYLPADINGDETHYRIIRVEGGTAVTFGLGQPNVSYNTVSHTATLTGVSQFSDWTLGESVTPTAVTFDSFTATNDGGGVSLQWKTGFEVNNLGFNIYRQVGAERVKINPSLIAGSALMVGSDVRVKAGSGYYWQDENADTNASYWLEDVDLDGTSTWHGPFGVSSAPAGKPKTLRRTKSVLLNNLTAGKAGVALPDNAVIRREYPADFAAAIEPVVANTGVTRGREPVRPAPVTSNTPLSKQWSIASQQALKIAINKSGWYHLNMVDLMAAGLNPGANPQTLQMFVGGTEVPIRVNTARPGVLAAGDSIEFYGSAIDTPTSDTQMYWLVSGSQTGKRIGIQQSPGSGSNSGTTSFAYTVERKDRFLYFSSLRNGDAENWFGSVVNSTPVTESLNVHNMDSNSGGQAQVEIALQGVSTNAHQVTVMLNNVPVKSISFNGMDHTVESISVPQASLVAGDNNITLVSQSSGDVSLVDYIRITYAHTYTADSNNLFTSVPAMQLVNLTGFTSNQIRAFDVANPNQPVEVDGTVAGDTGNYSISFGPAKQRNLLVFTADQMMQPLSITANQPSALNKGGVSGNFVIITYKDFAQNIQPFVNLKQSQGYKVAVVDVEDVYDEFSYGVHTPQAVKDFLSWTYLHWPTQPQYVMLAGSGTLDPKNYTGLGNLDFVPTKLIDTASMETASDDWFVDFNNDGQPKLLIGRLPVRSADEVATVVSKIVNYEKSGSAQTVLLVSDENDGVDFAYANSKVNAMVPSGFTTVNIVRGQTSTDAKTQLMNQLSLGNRIINYAGHGSVNLWRGNLLTDDDVSTLANKPASPLLVSMTCLNGYFQDPRAASLGESLVRVSQGGAVSVLASSAMTDNGEQTVMNQEFFKQLFSNQGITIGQAIKAAKAVEQDSDVRRTCILFGDPTMVINKQK